VDGYLHPGDPRLRAAGGVGTLSAVSKTKEGLVNVLVLLGEKIHLFAFSRPCICTVEFFVTQFVLLDP